MKYILKNIILFFKYDKKIFLLCVSSVCVSMLSILIAYGIYSNYMVQKLSSENDLRSLQIDISASEEKPLTKGIFTNALLSCPKEILNKVDMIFVKVPTEYNLSLELRFCVSDGKISGCTLFQDNLEQNGLASSYFTHTQEENGEKVALVYSGQDQKNEINDMLVDSNTIRILGHEYEIIGEQTWTYPVLIPYLSVDDTTILSQEYGIEMYFQSPINFKDYSNLKEKMQSQLHDYINFPEMYVDYNELHLYNSIIYILAFVITIAALNFCIFYKYILIKRRKNIAIFRICGFTKKNAIIHYMGECLLIVSVTLPAAIILFRYSIYFLLSKIYSDFENYYSCKTYFAFGIIYLIGSSIILFVTITVEVEKNSIVQCSSEGAM